MSSSEKRTLYLIPYVHLDTQWRWTTGTTISEYLPETVKRNLALIEEFPEYSINLTGAYRYALLEEYYPELFTSLKEAVRKGSWHPSGSLWEETDVLIPGAESIIRNILYGRSYFQRHFGRQTWDVMLPDSFGFHEDLPTILSHCRINGFSTQKMTWDPVSPIPFDIGIWNGPDGSALPVVLRPGKYTTKFLLRPDLHPSWLSRLSRHLRQFSVAKAVRYFGNGDIGRSPSRLSVKLALKAMRKQRKDLSVQCGASDLFFSELTDDERARLPRYAGELLLTKHSAGSLSSQRIVKRWNRRCEQLALLADLTSVIASQEIHSCYPKERLEAAWKLLIASQMHDTLPGTCVPTAYRDTYNILTVTANLFDGIIDDAVGAMARQLPLRKHEKAFFCINPNSSARDELIEMELPVTESEEMTITDDSGEAVPYQILSRTAEQMRLTCRVSVPSSGWSSYRYTTREHPVPSAEDEPASDANLIPESYFLENSILRVEVDELGNICSIIDKRIGKEILENPITHILLKERPHTFPAWNMDWKDRKRNDFVPLPPADSISFSQQGELLSTITVERRSGNSRFVHSISLHHQDTEDMVFCRDAIFWQESGCSLKLSIPLAFPNKDATYSLDTTKVNRFINDSHQYEYPSKGWINQDSEDGSRGFTFIHGDIYGSDRPDTSTIRPTLLFTPGRSFRTVTFLDQMTQDWGRHTFDYGFHIHTGPMDPTTVVDYGNLIANPIRPYHVHRRQRALRNHTSHPSRSSFISFSTDRMDLISCKRSEEDQSYIIIRLREIAGHDIPSTLITFNSQIDEAYEVDGLETPVHSVSIIGNALSVSLQRNSIKTFAVKLQNHDIAVSIDSEKHAPIQIESDTPEPLLSDEFDESEVSPSDRVRYSEIPIPHNIVTCSADQSFTSGDETFPLEQMPEYLTIEDIRMPLQVHEELHALACGGEQLELPLTPGGHTPTKLHLVVTARDAGMTSFSLGCLDGNVITHNCHIPAQTGYISQYDTRVWKKPGRSPRDYIWKNKLIRLEEGYVNPLRIAWVTTHMHAAGANIPHQFGYLYYLTIPLPEGAKNLILPDDIRIHLYSAAVSTMLVHTSSCRVASDIFDL